MGLLLKRLINPLLFTAISFASLGTLGRITPFENEVTIYIYELVMALTLLVLLFTYKLKPLIKIDEHFSAFRLFLTYLFINFLFLIFYYSVRENLIGFLYLLRLASYILFGIYILHHIRLENVGTKSLPFSLILFAVVTVVTAFTQYYLYPDLRNLSYLEWDPHLYRMFGLFLDPFLSAAVYGLFILFLFFKGNTIVKNHYVKFFLIGLLTVMFFLTYSRGAYIALLFSFFVYIVKQKKYIFIVLLFISFSLGLLLLPKKVGEGMNLMRTSTILTRLEDYKTGIEIWQKNPIIGVGYNRIRYEKIRLHKYGEASILKSHAGASFHSSFLILLVTSGIGGLVLFIYSLINVAKLSCLSLYSSIFLAIFSLTDNVFLHPLILFLYFIGITLSLNPSDNSL